MAKWPDSVHSRQEYRSEQILLPVPEQENLQIKGVQEAHYIEVEWRYQIPPIHYVRDVSLLRNFHSSFFLGGVNRSACAMFSGVSGIRSGIVLRTGRPLEGFWSFFFSVAMILCCYVDEI